MRPAELIRAAAKVLEERGWSQSPAGTNHHAFDGAGNGIGLWGLTRDSQPVDTSRATLNPNAASFTIYGALVAAAAANRASIENIGLLWDVLYRQAIQYPGIVTGGTNYVHPLIQLNNREGMTKAEVLAFLDAVATIMDTTMVQA